MVIRTQELKEADPEGFARLWQRGEVKQHESRPAPAYVLALEFVLAALLTGLLAFTTAAAVWHQVRPSLIARRSHTYITFAFYPIASAVSLLD